MAILKANKYVKTPKLKRYDYVGKMSGNRINLAGVTITFMTITDEILEKLMEQNPDWKKYFRQKKKETIKES